MTLKHPEYANGISNEELIKEALEFCNDELDAYEGMEYDDDSEVCCQRSNTFIRELVVRLTAVLWRPAKEPVAEIVAASTPAAEILYGRDVKFYEALRSLPIGAKLYAAPQPAHGTSATEREPSVTDEMVAAARKGYSKAVGCDDTPHVLDGWIEDALRAALEAALNTEVN